MLLEMHGKVGITSNKKLYEFIFKFHKAIKKEERQMEPDFYDKCNESNQTHYDVEIVSIEGKVEFPKGLHIHESKLNGKKFMCWTGQLPTCIDVIKTVNTWCMGTVYTIETGIDFADLYDDPAGVNASNFNSIDPVFARDHGIDIYMASYSMD